MQSSLPWWKRPSGVYGIQVLLLMCVAYPVLLLGSLAVLPHVSPGPLRAAVSLVPAIPVLLVGVALARFWRHSDELQRRIQLQAMTAALFAVMGLAVTAGFLEVGGVEPLSAWAYVIVGGVVWLAGAIFLQLRYR